MDTGRHRLNQAFMVRRFGDDAATAM